MRIDKVNRLKIPTGLYLISNLATSTSQAKIYYSFEENALYLSKNEEEDFALAKINIDQAYRFSLPKEVCKSFNITTETNLLLCEKQGRIYLKQMN